ncbi:MAG: phosphopyruvate hydratase [bacterium]
MSTIKEVKAREILASSGTPTIEVTVTLDNGISEDASVSFGASAGTKEAFVLLDGDEKRFFGKGMLKAVESVNGEIRTALIGKNVQDQKELDELMCTLDNTKNKSRLGANAILGVSMAICKAAAHDLKLPLYKYVRENLIPKYFPEIVSVLNTEGYILPNPMMVSIEGGKHANNSTDLQEYCISVVDPLMSLKEKVRAGEEVYMSLGKILKSSGYSTNVGNEGAFAPEGISSNENPLEYITKAINDSGYLAQKQIGISIDAAASEFYKDSKYILKLENTEYTSSEIIEYYLSWFEKYPIISVEDFLSEFDWNNWPVLFNKLKEKKPNIKVVTDDITVTNPEILKKAIVENIGNAIIIKLNQIGTVTKTLEACEIAKLANWTNIFSHRGGGESNDTTMIDLAVATNSGFVKVGPTRGERVAKYNRLMRIEEELLNR